MNLKLSLTTYVKINSKWIIDLNMNVKNIKLLEKKIRENSWDLQLGVEFLDITPETSIYGKIFNKLDFIKINSACSVKDPDKRMKR